MSQGNRDANQIIDKAMRDEAFRRRLLNDPKSALKNAFGIDVPAGVNVHIHEETPNDIHITLPPAPQSGIRELSDAELESAVGGMMSREGGGTGCCTCGSSTGQTWSSLQKGCGC